MNSFQRKGCYQELNKLTRAAIEPGWIVVSNKGDFFGKEI